MSVFKSLGDMIPFGRKRKLSVSKRFELNTVPAKGATSRVYVATDIPSGSRFALKLIDPAKTENIRGRFKDRTFESEGEIHSRFRTHPEIVYVHETGMTTERQEFILMELMDGPTLDHFTKPDTFTNLPDRVSLILQMARAIFAVHEQKFVHRDICPRNFVLSQDLTNCKLFDFGLTIPADPDFYTTSNRSGTPQTLAPEIARRRPADRRVDVFSFGVTAYLVLTGHHPWDTNECNSRSALVYDSRPATDIRQHVPNLNPRLVKVIHHCLEINPEKRMPNFKNFLAQASDIKIERKVLV